MVVFTALDQTARDVALHGERVYNQRSSEVFRELNIIFGKHGIRKWKAFGSGQAGTATITSDIDIQVGVPGTIKDMMDILKQDANLTRNMRYKWSETRNRKMVVLGHRNGMTVDVILVKELGGESVDNTDVIRWWATEDLYKNTVQAIKKLFKGKN